MTILQTKRSAKPKLTKEEKVFFQCCRERRSYSENQDLDSVVCPISGSVRVIRNGTRSGSQRYLFRECKKTFGDTNGTVAFRSKLSIGKWIEMFCVNTPFLSTSERTYTVCLTISEHRIQPTHIDHTLVSYFSEDTVLVTDSHRAYKTVANRHKIPLKQIPSGKHTSGGYSLGHINGYHHNISDFMYLYHGVSSNYINKATIL